MSRGFDSIVRKEMRDMLKQETLPPYGISSVEELVIQPCAYCEGIGEVNVGVFVEEYEPCPVCNESGNVRVPSDYPRCYKCDGTGRENVGEYVQWFMPCQECHGTGWTQSPPVYR